MNSMNNTSIVLRKKGIFYPSPLYISHGVVYAKFGSGFIRPDPDKSTSLSGVTWVAMEHDHALYTIEPEPKQGLFTATMKASTLP